MSQHSIETHQHNSRETATLAGGCFWCLEAIFNEVAGIEKVVSGYSGGNTDSPSYRDVCSGLTGHAEAVQLTLVPQVISYKKLLQIFFSVHDPTTPNRQRADAGTQYRSAIFYHTEEQKITAEQVIKELNKARIWPAPIVTEVKPYQEFYPAEEYHQRYLQKNPEHPYCRAVIAPKLAKFLDQYSAMPND